MDVSIIAPKDRFLSKDVSPDGNVPFILCDNVIHALVDGTILAN